MNDVVVLATYPLVVETGGRAMQVPSDLECQVCMACSGICPDDDCPRLHVPEDILRIFPGDDDMDMDGVIAIKEAVAA